MKHHHILKIENTFRPDDLLPYLRKQDVFTFLNSNRNKNAQADRYSNFDWALAVGVDEEISGSENGFDALKKLYEKKKNWLFGFLTYDLKNDLEDLSSNNNDGVKAPRIHFYSPETVMTSRDHFLTIMTDENKFTVEDGVSLFHGNKNSTETSEPEKDHLTSGTNRINLKSRVTIEEYIHAVGLIKQHIHRGDIYEMNYCIEFFAEDISLDPYRTYVQLNELSPAPFSCFYRNRELFLMSVSPERFVAKRKSKIISQPIKGTARRGNNAEEDDRIISVLKNDPKERSENVMIVDLVRNDLSRTAKKGSVQVEELFGIYTFPQLHQMISTVVSEVKDDVHATDVIKNSFPMGSMTGAPKIRAMQLIEEFEQTKRGLYSGSTGYITPEGDFDFNVIIRSILYNRANRYLSFMVGSAITANSDAEKEYDECLLKAKALLDVLNGKQAAAVIESR